MFYDEPDEIEEDEIKLEDTYDNSIKIIIQNNYHTKLVNLLLNPSKIVSLNAAGCLKNICICGGNSFCEFLYKRNICDTLLQLFNSINADTSELNINYIINIISLSSVLCEDSEEILVSLSVENVFDKIFMVFTTELSNNLNLSLITSEFLYVLSENNPLLNEYLQKSSHHINIINVIQNKTTERMLLLYFIGVVINTFSNVTYTIGISTLFDRLYLMLNQDITEILKIDYTIEKSVENVFLFIFLIVKKRNYYTIINIRNYFIINNR